MTSKEEYNFIKKSVEAIKMKFGNPCHIEINKLWRKLRALRGRQQTSKVKDEIKKIENSLLYQLKINQGKD